MPFERPATVNEPSDKFPAQSFAVRDGSKTLDFDLSALAIDGSWTFPVPAAGDAAKVLFGDGSWQSIPGGGDMLGANNLSDVANAGTARTNLGLGSLATLSTINTAQITDSAVTDAKIDTVAATKITGTIATAQIANSAVTDAKISAVATSKLTGTIATAQIADTAVTDAKISAVAASKLTGSIAPARLGVTVDKTLPYNNAGTLAGSNIILDGTGGRSLWIAQDDAASFLRIGSNLNTYIHLRNDGNNIIRTLGGGNALFINDNSDAITNIATGTGNATLGNTTGTTTVYGSTLTIQGTTLKINVGSDAAGDIYYRDASGNFVRLPKGTDGQVLTLASGLPSWAAAGGTSVKIDTFTSSDTWTKESWAQTVEVVVVGGGGGGGSGRRDTTANARRGGGGGGSGGFNHAVFLASTLGATVTVTVGAGGTGGGSVTTDSTNGQGATSAAGSSSFGNHLRATAGGAGVGGQSGGGGGTGGGASSGNTGYNAGNGTAGGASGTTGNGTAGTNSSAISPTGGGGAAGTNGTTDLSGAAGGAITVGFVNVQADGGTAGTAGGSGGNGVAVPALWTTFGTGGGGGAYRTGQATGAGGNGGLYGGGGGGGAGSDNGFASGKGGDGGSGICVVIQRA